MKKEVEEGDEPRAETESESEEELSCFAPTVRKHTPENSTRITLTCRVANRRNNSSSSSRVCVVFILLAGARVELCIVVVNGLKV